MYRLTTPRVFKKDESEWGKTEDSFMVSKVMSNLAARGKIESFIIITPDMCPRCHMEGLRPFRHLSHCYKVE